TVTGVKTAAGNGDIDLVNQPGTLPLAQPVSAGSGTVRINSATAVTQTAGGAGAVTGTNLAVLAGGSVDLCEVANAVPGKVAINTTSGFVRFLDAVGYAVDTVTPAAGDLCFTATVTGVTTGAGNGDITLGSEERRVGIARPVSAGSGTVRINSATAVTQPAGGASA